MLTRSFYSLAVICFIAMVVAPLLSGKTEGETYKFDVSPNQTVKLDLKSGGSASIVGWDKSEAEVSYVQGGTGPEHRVEVTKEGSDLVITAEARPHEGSAASLDFEIRVPHRFNVIFESAGGDLKIEGLEGEFEGRTMGGNLSLIDSQGTVRIKTMGGDVEVTGGVLDGKVTTMGGEVLVKDVVGDLNAGSMGGDIRYENVRGHDGKLRAPGSTSETDVKQKTVSISTMGGDLVLDEAPEGALLSTMGGDIVVKDAHDFVSASTMGGSIDIHATDAWVQASTMAGDIDVEIDGGLGDGKEGVELSSCVGDVTLVVPSDLSMNLDLTIAYTRNSGQDFKIISDFDVQIERSNEWDYSNGTPRKRIEGTGKVAGGKYPIVIKTINGDIRVLKAK
jgi:DUF4097 and DUF4098 domain-containing protein YvlB